MTAALLIALLVTYRQCADSVSKFVTSFGDEGSAKTTAPVPRPGEVDQPSTAPAIGSAGDYELIKPGMTEEEVKAAIERAKAKAAAQEAAGSGARSPTGTGSAGSAAAR